MTASESLRDTLHVGATRRRTSFVAVVVLAVLVVVNLATVCGVGVLVVHERDARMKQQAMVEEYRQIVRDVYRSLNDANRQLAALGGQPPPPPITPPAAQSQSARTTPTRPAAPSNRSTTTTTAPNRPGATTPTTHTTAPPPPPPPSSTTTTTIRPCTTIPTIGICRPL